MTKKINCKSKTKIDSVRVRIIRAPIVNTNDLRQVVFARSRAIVL